MPRVCHEAPINATSLVPFTLPHVPLSPRPPPSSLTLPQTFRRVQASMSSVVVGTLFCGLTSEVALNFGAQTFITWMAAELFRLRGRELFVVRPPAPFVLGESIPCGIRFGGMVAGSEIGSISGSQHLAPLASPFPPSVWRFFVYFAPFCLFHCMWLSQPNRAGGLWNDSVCPSGGTCAVLLRPWRQDLDAVDGGAHGRQLCRCGRLWIDAVDTVRMGVVGFQRRGLFSSPDLTDARCRTPRHIPPTAVCWFRSGRMWSAGRCWGCSTPAAVLGTPPTGKKWATRIAVPRLRRARRRRRRRRQRVGTAAKGRSRRKTGERVAASLHGHLGFGPGTAQRRSIDEQRRVLFSHLLALAASG